MRDDGVGAETKDEPSAANQATEPAAYAAELSPAVEATETVVVESEGAEGVEQLEPAEEEVHTVQEASKTVAAVDARGHGRRG